MAEEGTDQENGRNKTARRSYQEILSEKIAEGLTEIKRPWSGLFLSGLSAGLDIGFSVLLMSVVFTRFHALVDPEILKTLLAFSYPVGFILVIFGRSELFTEHTTLAVLPVIGGKASLLSLIRLWAVVYFANVLGAAIFSALLVLIGSSLGIIENHAYGSIAETVVQHSWSVILLSAIFAGWLMGLTSWLVTAGKETISQIFFVWLITFSIGVGQLHHSIAGTVEVLPALYLHLIPSVDFVRTMVWMTIGNAIGGIVFVALIKYSHITQS